jgi:hypothetical protein
MFLGLCDVVEGVLAIPPDAPFQPIDEAAA